MEIFKFAIQMEKDGEAFYRRLAGQVREAGVREILTMLAEDEVKHALAIDQMRTRVGKMADTKILDKAKNIFKRMKDFSEPFDFDHSHEELYRQAMSLEQKSIDFYLDRADQTDDPAQKALLEQLADEEQRHFRLLEGLADFVSRPRTWLEDAEFTHLEEY